MTNRVNRGIISYCFLVTKKVKINNNIFRTMKHLLITFLLLCIGISNINAAWITITSSTKSQTWGESLSLTLGSISYDQATKTLTLNKCRLYDHEAIAIKTPGVTVKIKGECNILSQRAFILDTDYEDANLTFTSDNETSGVKNCLYIRFLAGSYEYMSFIDSKDSKGIKNTVTIKNTNVGILDEREISYYFKGHDDPVATHPVISNASTDGSKNVVIFDNSSFTYSSLNYPDKKYTLFHGPADLKMRGSMITDHANVKMTEEGLDFGSNDELNGHLNIGPGSKYGVTVMGFDVNTINEDDVLGDGTMKYDANTNTLALNGVYANNMSHYYAQAIKAVPKDKDSFTLEVTGNNSFYNYEFQGPQVEIGSFTFFYIKNKSASGNLTLQQFTASPALKTNASLTTIKDCTFMAFAEKSSTAVEGNGQNLLLLDNIYSIVNAQTHAYSNFLSMGPSHCDYSKPEGVEYNGTRQFLVSDGKNCPSVTISKKSFDIKVNGVQITSTNQDDVLGNGMVHYWPEGNRLYLKDATALNSLDINMPCEVYLSGDNIIMNTAKCFTTTKDVTITGDRNSSLSVLAFSGDAVVLDSCDLKVSNVTFNVNGINGCAITSTEGKSNVVFNNVKASIDSKVTNIYNMTFIGCAITNTNTYFDKTQHAIVENGEIKTSFKDGYITVEQCTPYGLRINGIEITSLNVDDDIADGTVKYNPATNALELNNASLACNKMSPVYIYKPMTIDLTGTNNLTVTAGSNAPGFPQFRPIHADADIVIRTAPTATKAAVLNLSGDHSAFYTDGHSTTVQNCNVIATGTYYGWTDNGGNSRLVVDNANLRMKGTSKDAVNHIGTLTTIGTQITYPIGATFSDETKNFVNYPPVVSIGVLGDYNIDCKVTMDDARLILSSLIKNVRPMPAKSNTYNADVTGDGKITIADANAIVNLIVK